MNIHNSNLQRKSPPEYGRLFVTGQSWQAHPKDAFYLSHRLNSTQVMQVLVKSSSGLCDGMPKEGNPYVMGSVVVHGNASSEFNLCCNSTIRDKSDRRVFPGSRRVWAADKRLRLTVRDYPLLTAANGYLNYEANADSALSLPIMGRDGCEAASTKLTNELIGV